MMVMVVFWYKVMNTIERASNDEYRARKSWRWNNTFDTLRLEDNATTNMSEKKYHMAKL